MGQTLFLAGKAPVGLRELYRLPLGLSLISYQHETDKSDNRIIRPSLVMIKLTTQPYGAPWSAVDAVRVSTPKSIFDAFQLLAKNAPQMAPRTRSG